MSQLAHKLGLDTSTLTRNIQKLEKMELIKRNHDSYDKRVQKAVLTEKGDEMVELLEEYLLEMNHSIMEQIDLDSQESITDILEKIVWAMDCIREK
jgi:DNA-binding MarR family transcriptional regulator